MPERSTHTPPAPELSAKLTPDVTKGATRGPSTVNADSYMPAERFGRYELQGEIAHGGMGVIYAARDAAFEREVAIKILHRKYAPDSVAARRFLDEAKITGQLQHPAIRCNQILWRCSPLSVAAGFSLR